MALPRDRRFSSISTFPVPDESDNNVYKIITLGNVGVGKSTLIASYCRGTCQTDLTQQLNVDSKMVKRGERLIQISLWDTAGKITNVYIVHVCLLFVVSAVHFTPDLTSLSSMMLI